MSDKLPTTSPPTSQQGKIEDALKAPEVTQETLLAGLRDPNLSVTGLAAGHPKLTPETISTALGDNKVHTTSKVALMAHPNVSDQNIIEGMSHDNSRVVNAAWRSPRVNGDLIDRYLDMPFPLRDSDYTKALAHPEVTSRHLKKLVEKAWSVSDLVDKQDMFWDISEHPACDEATVDALIDGGMQGAARIPNLTDSQLLRAVKQKHFFGGSYEHIKNHRFKEEHLDALLETHPHVKLSPEVIPHMIECGAVRERHIDQMLALRFGYFPTIPPSLVKPILHHPEISQSTLSAVIREGTSGMAQAAMDNPKLTPENAIQAAIDRDDSKLFDHEKITSQAHRLIESENPHRRMLIAGNPHLHRHHIEALVRDPDASVRRHLFHNSRLLTEDDFRYAMAQEKDSPLEGFEGESLGRGWRSIIGSPSVTPAILDEIAAAPKANDAVQQAVNHHLAGHGLASEALRLRLMDSSATAAHRILSNPTVPPSVLYKGAQHADPNVATTALRNQNADAGVIAAALEKHRGNGRVEEAAIVAPNFNAKHVDMILAKEPNEGTVTHLLNRRVLNEKQLERIIDVPAHNPSAYETRLATLVTNKGVTPKVLNRAVELGGYSTARSAANSPKADASVLETCWNKDLSQSALEGVRSAVAASRLFPAHLLGEAVGTGRPAILTGVLPHPELKGQLLEDAVEQVFRKDNDSFGRTVVKLAENPNLTPEHVDRILKTGNTTAMIDGLFGDPESDVVPLEALAQGVGAAEQLSETMAILGEMWNYQNILHSKAVPEEWLKEGLMFHANPDSGPRPKLTLNTAGKVLAAASNPNLSDESLAEIADAVKRNPLLREYVSASIEQALEARKAPEKREGAEIVRVAHNTEKLRALRDYIESAGGAIHKSKLPKGGIPDSVGRLLNHKGELTAQAVQAMIDQMPRSKFTVTHSLWGGAQKHTSEFSKVFQVNLSSELLQQLKAAGVYRYLLNQTQTAINHPHARGIGLGWIRYTGDAETGFHIDEIQTDIPNFIESYRKNNPHSPLARGLERVLDICFGDRYPNNVFHDIFHEYMRQKHGAGVKIALLDSLPKAPLSGLDIGRPLPKSSLESYRANPQKLGYEEGTYGQIPTQSNPRLKGEKTWTHVLRKEEEPLEKAGDVSLQELVEHIQASLTDEDRAAKYKGKPNPLAGQCYVAAEALYHMLGGHTSAWTPMWIKHEGEPHWYLHNTETKENLDPTASQFKSPPPYDRRAPDGKWDTVKGPVPKGFLTKAASKRTQGVLQRVQARMLTPRILRKAVEEEPITRMVDKVDPQGEGKASVNHKPHLTSAIKHPEADLYDSEVLRSPHLFSPLPFGGIDNGSFAKMVMEHPSGQRYMLKAYHDRLRYIPSVPTEGLGSMELHSGQEIDDPPKLSQGWAEMTSQALYHAAGIGHLHQKVFVREHPTLSGEKEPMLGIVMHKGAKILHDSRPDRDQLRQHQNVLVPQMLRIALMDYLSNNVDRHEGNLMIHEDNGAPSLLAIDNSFSHQHVTSQGDDRYIPSLPDAVLSAGMQGLYGDFRAAGVRPDSYPHVSDLASWWREKAPLVAAEFRKHLAAVQHDHRSVVQRAFDARHRKLGDWANRVLVSGRADNFGW